jgi:Uma2 family endonuclease
MTTQTKHMTAEDLLAMPDDGLCYELVRGELKRMSPAGEEHGYLAVEIASDLRNHVKANKLGRVYAAETGFKLRSDPDTVRAPDAAFVSQERLERQPPGKGYRLGAPDLVVEVISPGDLHAEVEEKVFSWLDHGARLVITVNPRQRTATVYRSRTGIVVLTEDEQLEGGEVVPGWTLKLRELFAGL